MHENWQELIPFYIAGSLTKAEAQKLERHLSKCIYCRQVLDDWRTIGRVVRAEAESWGLDLPPLSPQIQAQLGSQISVNGHHEGEATQSFMRPVYQRMTASRTRSWVAPTMAAAVLVVVLSGALLWYLANRKPLQEVSLTNIAGLPTGTSENGAGSASQPSATPSPTAAIILATNTVFATQPQPTVTIQPNATPTRRPTARPAMLPPTVTSSQCTATNTGTTAVNIYEWPGTDYAIVGTIQRRGALPVLLQNGQGWYEVMTSGIVGWIQATSIQFGGPCENLPYPSPTFVPMTSTPTAAYGGSIGTTGYNLMTTEQVGAIPAGTRVRIGSAYFTGSEWIYQIATQDEQITADARESQLAYAPPDVAPTATPVAETPSPTPTPEGS
jgi:uncharacterized protein YraI